MPRVPRRQCIGLVGVGLLCTATQAGVVHVDDDAPPGGDGVEWATAYRFLQDALTAAAPGDEIRVGQGVYYADRDEMTPAGTGAREASFVMTNGVVLAGGYAGFGAPDPDARDVALYASELDGDLLGDDTEYQGRDDNTAHLLILDAVDASTRLDGIVVRSGNADVDNGGGALITGGAPIVQNCSFIDNFGARGGGVYAVGSTATFIGCMFRDNRGAAPYVTNYGAGLCSDKGALDVRDCVFVGNRCSSGGGFMEENGASTLTGCVFEANDGGSGSGAMALDSTTTFSSCRFAGNRAAACSDGFPCSGGGLSIRGDISVLNCLFVGNRGADGAAILVAGGSPQIVNCTMFGNLPAGYGTVYAFAGTPSLVNCILWNDALHGPPISVRYSIVENGYPGGSVSSADPGFPTGPIGIWTDDVVYDASTGQSTVTDANATFTPGALVGHFVNVPGLLGRPRGRRILANTETTITVWGNARTQGEMYTVTDLRPGPGSPAIDAGFASPALDGVSEDHDGEPRRRDDPATPDAGCGGTCPVDIGAFEFQVGTVRCCPADLDGSLGVDFGDLVRILTAWGPCPPVCPEDVDGSGAVDFGDILFLLAAWGPCPTSLTGACCFDGGCAMMAETACASVGGVYQGDCASCGDRPLCAGACGLLVSAPTHLTGDGRTVRYDFVIPYDGVWRLTYLCGFLAWPDIAIGTGCNDADILRWTPFCEEDEPPPFIDVAIEAGTYGFTLSTTGEPYTLIIAPIP